MTVLAKLPARVRARGVREVGTLAAHRAREAIRSHDRLIFFARSALTSGAAPVHPKVEGLRLKRAAASDGPSYAQAIGTDSATTFSKRLTKGTRCYLVLGADGVVHATWVTTTASWVREIGRYFRPPVGDAYVFESFTPSDARGRGVYPFALLGICDDLARDGIERVWVAVEAGNTPSLKAVTKAGFEEAFELDYRRRMGRLSLSGPRGRHADLCSSCFVKKLSD